VIEATEKAAEAIKEFWKTRQEAAVAGVLLR